MTSFATRLLIVSALITEIVASQRPVFNYWPKQPWRPMPPSPPRTKTCYVATNGPGIDDSANIISALQQCNHGGHVVFRPNTIYTVGKPMNLTFLDSVDVDIEGTIQFTNNATYWQANSFKFAFQNTSSFFVLGGRDVNIYGGGTIDGQGQIWWDLIPLTDDTVDRPILFNIDGLNGGSVSDLHLMNPPNWFNVIQNSQDVTYDSLNMTAISNGTYPAANSDGWDTFRSSNIVIQNCNVNNDDDCVAFKPNSTEILVQNMHCNGSHGISVGSLGQYLGETDIVENVYISNIHMSNASDGARIKVWPGVPPGAAYGSGGGNGYVRNITYNGVHNQNNAWAIEVTQCYGVSNQSICNAYPSSLTIEDCYFYNFDGTTSTEHEPYVATVVCSSPNVCSDLYVKNFTVVSPEGTNAAICTNVNNATIGLNCTTA